MGKILFFSFSSVIGLTIILGGCVSPSLKFHKQAIELGFHGIEYRGKDFIHQVYANRKTLGHFLHVYLGSDGTPWETPNKIATDPTPRNPLMLRLMALDTAASVYVGRPCYHGFSQSLGCHPRWWTSGRYSERVVESLYSVLIQISKEYGTNEIVIFGYSGGGALAILLAKRLPKVQAIVTIAGNLDIDAWADYHSYSPLTESINPISRFPLREELIQIHVIGDRDKVIPPHLGKFALKQQANSKTIVIADADHQCCWETLWPSLLSRVNKELEKKKP